jgi:glutamyl-tRNA reductase
MAGTEDPEAALTAMYDHGESVRREAVETALARLDGLDADQQAEVEALADRLVEGLLASPTASLVTADDEQIGTALALFGREDREEETDGGIESGEPDAAAATAGD